MPSEASLDLLGGLDYGTSPLEGDPKSQSPTESLRNWVWVFAAYKLRGRQENDGVDTHRQPRTINMRSFAVLSPPRHSAQVARPALSFAEMFTQGEGGGQVFLGWGL